MNYFHCHISRPQTAAGTRNNYIERTGKYSQREDRVYCESGNLPSWAKDAQDFWKTCEKNERGSQYTEIEFALPNEVSLQTAVKMAQSICHDDLHGHAYTMAIHENIGRISGIQNRHVHVMYTEREIEPNRPEPNRENYFKKSRTRKDGSVSGGYRKAVKMTKDRTHTWFHGVRKHIEQMINREMEQINSKERVSCESYKRQGKDIVPQIHVGAKSVALKDDTYQLNEEIKSARQDLKTARQELQQIHAQMGLLDSITTLADNVAQTAKGGQAKLISDKAHKDRLQQVEENMYREWDEMKLGSEGIPKESNSVETKRAKRRVVVRRNSHKHEMER